MRKDDNVYKNEGYENREFETLRAVLHDNALYEVVVTAPKGIVKATAVLFTGAGHKALSKVYNNTWTISRNMFWLKHMIIIRKLADFPR